MFEREVMISSLKKQSETLARLVQEMEQNPRVSRQDTEYYHESLKKIEASLKRMRRMDEDDILNNLSSKYYAHPMSLRDLS